MHGQYNTQSSETRSESSVLGYLCNRRKRLYAKIVTGLSLNATVKVNCTSEYSLTMAKSPDVSASTKLCSKMQKKCRKAK